MTEQPDKLTVSWQASLQIWIDRFGRAQQEIRGLEAQNRKLVADYEIALSLMTDEQLAQLVDKRAQPSELEQRMLSIVNTEQSSCGPDCGCGEGHG